MIFLEIVVALKATSDKLGVVDVTIFIGVHDVHCIIDVFLCQKAATSLKNTLLQFLYCQLSVSVEIKFRESISESFNLILRNSRCNQSQSGTFEVHSINVVSHVV